MVVVVDLLEEQQGAGALEEVMGQLRSKPLQLQRALEAEEQALEARFLFKKMGL